MRKLNGFWKHFITFMSVALVLFQIYTAGFGVFPDIVQRSVHLFFVLGMIYIRKPITPVDNLPAFPPSLRNP